MCILCIKYILRNPGFIITVLLLILLAAAYFVFMATEATLLYRPSCIPEITEVHSSVLFDLLVMLTMMLGAVALDSPLER